MGDELHKLYLFEFLVHSVTYHNSTLKLDPKFLKGLGPTCVQFKGKNLPTLMVSEIDFCSKDNFNTNTVKFKSGKSSLFSLGNICFDECKLNCQVTLKRKLPEGEDNSHYCMGQNDFCLNDKFIRVLNSPGTEAVSQCLKLSLDMKNELKETVGVVRLLLRLTCFGTVIVTEFQRNLDNSKTFLFKGDRIVPKEDESYGDVNQNNIVGSRPQVPSNMFPPSQMMQQLAPPMFRPPNQLVQGMSQPTYPAQPMQGMQQMMQGMQQPIQGMQQPIQGMQQGMQQPMQGMQLPMQGMQLPMQGMQQTMQGMQLPMQGMQQQMPPLPALGHQVCYPVKGYF